MADVTYVPSITDKIIALFGKTTLLTTDDVVQNLQLPRRDVEDALWDLWAVGVLQMMPDSRFRLARVNEKIFRYDV